MKNINWKIRLKNKTFWMAIVPAMAIALQTLLAIFGIDVDYTDQVAQLLEFINAVFVVLMIIGIVADPTTTGVTDSSRVMDYHIPNAKKRK